ncbi:mitochondrial intermediate peptidase [Schistocerca nitens]|uniref:mitochondrial intermediate peptidase n=1 Tax=Schistocerca nitens TaxID=7011 RepID=UPI0021174823|nr:mitochondrial intermediate peptidase [Schistocerca nitens]
MSSVFRKLAAVKIKNGTFNKVGVQKVSTWSPLATAFNSRPARKLNFSISQDDVGLFGLPELRTYDGFYSMKENAVLETDKLIAESCDPNRSRKMVEVFDELSDTLCKVADLAEFIRIAHPKAAYSQAAEDACVSISGIVEKLNTHRELYSALRNVAENKDKFETTPVDEHVAQLFLFDFEQCGIHLPESDRCRVVELNDYILQLGQRFMAGAVSPRAIPKEVLPKNIRHLFTIDGDQVLVTGLYADSPNAAAREAAYRIFLYPDGHQEYLLEEMLKARHELAKLCGFPTYSHRALKASIVEMPSVVNEFLDILTEQLWDRAAADFHTMMRMKCEEDPLSQQNLAPWDTPYFTQKVKRDWLQVGSSEFSPYLSLGACMEGLNTLTNSLYNISLVNDEVRPGEVWSPDVYKLAVVHKDEGLLGHIYCDFYERPGKPNQDCHFTIRGGKELPDGSYQNPVVVLMLNLPTPRWSSPSLLTPSMVDNLFHEVGHAMHSMLARTKYQHVTGTRCSTDFAEVPSVLMEYFAADPRVVQTFARHFQTQEKMPEDMLIRLCASKHLFAASEMQLQVFYSALDQCYHSHHPLQGSTTDVLAQLQNKYYGIPCVANTAWQLRFSHLVGYGAKYYSYLLSRALASWIWQEYFEANPLSSSAGEKYRRECLAHGGGKPAKELVSQFLQRDVTPVNLAHSLITEIDNKREHINNVKRTTSCQA